MSTKIIFFFSQKCLYAIFKTRLMGTTDLKDILAIGQLLVGKRLAVDRQQHVADTDTVPLTKGYHHALVLKLQLDVQGIAVGLNRKK